MKKLICTLGLFLGLTSLGKAQAKISMDLGKDICIDSFTAYYGEKSLEDFSMGCGGEYAFAASQSRISAIVINGVVCAINGETELVLDDKKVTVKIVNVGNTIVDDLNGLIR